MAGKKTPESDWLARVSPRGRFWVLPEFKIVFVSVAKNACTSIKWALTDLAREDPSLFKAGLQGYTDDSGAVHNRDLHPNIPHFEDLDPKMRAEIHTDNGWFIFAVVRDPRSRLFSAWQDKILMAYPASVYRSWSDQPWYPAHPGADAEAINRQFADFVAAAVSGQDFAPRRNTHFRTQSQVLDTRRVPYTAIYPIEKLAELRADLTRHVQQLGWTEPITFRRNNETTLRANASTFAGGVRAQVEQWYADDFAEFGEHFDFSRIEAVPEWTAAELREVQVRAALHRRLGDIRELALEYRRQAEEAQQLLEEQAEAHAAKRAARQAAKAERQATKAARKAAGGGRGMPTG